MYILLDEKSSLQDVKITSAPIGELELKLNALLGIYDKLTDQ